VWSEGFVIGQRTVGSGDDVSKRGGRGVGQESSGDAPADYAGGTEDEDGVL
jgi:hypothetical protein